MIASPLAARSADEQVDAGDALNYKEDANEGQNPCASYDGC